MNIEKLQLQSIPVTATCLYNMDLSFSTREKEMWIFKKWNEYLHKGLDDRTTVRDYVTYAPNLEKLRKEVARELVIRQREGSAKITVSKCSVHYNVNQSVTICRMTFEELRVFKKIESLKIIGVAKHHFIKNDSDVLWKPYGKRTYLEVCPSVITYYDEEGIMRTLTRPSVLHCVLA